MKAIFVLLLLLCELTAHTGSVLSRTDKANTRLWKTRVSVALRFVRTQPCWRFLNPTNCKGVSSVPVQKMNVYIAQKVLDNEKLMATLPDKRHYSLLPSNQHLHDGVLVIDPYPHASFGHLVFIFFIEENANEPNCTKDGNGRFTAFGDCIRAANKTNCQNNVDERKRKKCWINFLPLVYSRKDLTKTQRLVCKERFLGFGKCKKTIPAQVTSCQNSPRCPNNLHQVPISCLWKKCDYAVLISGGWNTQTSQTYHAKNLKLFWRFLRRNKFNKNHITTFYGSDGAIELDGDDAAPAVSETSIRHRINKLCDSLLCVDSLVIYLTGPSTSNGALLLWDANGDGLTENTEKYNVREIFEDLENCNANRVFVVADYSYSGHLAHRLTKYRHENKKQYSHITVLTSSRSNEYAWGSEFTKSFFQHAIGNETRCMDEIFEDVKEDLRQRQVPSTPVLAEGSHNSGNITVYGKRCGSTRSVALKREMDCTMISFSEIQNKFAKQRKSLSQQRPRKRPSS